jgi:sugar phosphate isomerase/epimerase
MKLGLHAYSLLLASGYREWQPVVKGTLTATELLNKASRWGFEAVQLARAGVPVDDPVALMHLREQAAKKELLLHLSTGQLDSEHLVSMIHAAHHLGAPQVTVGLCCLLGSVKDRQKRLEGLLLNLDTAIKRAERYGIDLVFENGRHTAAADLAAFIQAAQSERVHACFDMGNALTVPESPIEAARVLGPYCRSAHLKDLQVQRTTDGVVLVNCPIGEGVVEVIPTLRELKRHQPDLPVFLQTGAERLHVPLLREEFLTDYPRITARAIAWLLRQGALVYDEHASQFPHERKDAEKDVIKWEDERLKRSLKQARILIGEESMSLDWGEGGASSLPSSGRGAGT